jgi:ABC-type uncharacterized transport system substrate-binding protein
LLQATRSVPIVFAIVPDPLGSGFIESLSRPGGNATGFLMFEYSLSGKWLELLKEIAPDVTRAAVLRGYGPRLVQIYRDMISRQVVAILRGANPAEMPVEQPTHFDLVVNLRAARAIGLDLPASLVLRADRLIE